MKLIFLASSAAIVYYMRYDRVVKQTYDRRQDTFRYLFLIVPCLILALLINHAFTLTEVGPGCGATVALLCQAYRHWTPIHHLPFILFTPLT